MERRQLPLFDCYMCEMGSKLHRSLLQFTQRVPLIINDNSEISEGCLSKMVGSFDRLLWRVGLPWQNIQSKSCTQELVHTGQRTCVSCMWEREQREGTTMKESIISVHSVDYLSSLWVYLHPSLSSFLSLLCIHSALLSIVHWCPLTFSLYWHLSWINSFH